MSFHETAFVAGMGIISILLLVLILALFTSGATLRMRIAVVGKDGKIRSEWAHKNKIRAKNGHPWYEFRGALYDWTGPWYAIDYRMVRSFGTRKYQGAQRIYIEGNPTSYRFSEDERMASLSRTAVDLYNEAESDLPNRLLKPRRADFLIIALVALMTLAIGFALGGRFG